MLAIIRKTIRNSADAKSKPIRTSGKATPTVAKVGVNLVGGGRVGSRGTPAGSAPALHSSLDRLFLVCDNTPCFNGASPNFEPVMSL